MSLPVSHYEALLEAMRGLRRKAQHVQQLATPLITSSGDSPIQPSTSKFLKRNELDNGLAEPLDYTMDSVLLERQKNSSAVDYNGHVINGAEGDTTCSEDEFGAAGGTHMSVSSEPISQRNRAVSSLYHGTWPVERTMWNSDPSNLAPDKLQTQPTQADMTSVMSFASSSGGAPLDRVLGSPDRSRRSSSSQLEAKVDMIYSLLAMLGGQEHADMGETLLALSTNPESCLAMRQSGCIPLLVQLVQSDRDGETRWKASQALNNLINAQPDEKLKKREIRIFKLLEQARSYTDAIRNNTDFELDTSLELDEGGDPHPVQTVAHLMKLSFDEGHRQTICQLGGIHIISHLIEAEHSSHGSTTEESHCVLLRRYACMTLTNLTFGDSGNKALLCSYREFMRALVIQLQSSSDELRQVTASVLRNLSWRADATSKDILREVGTVTGLMKAAMLDSKENTLKSILSALWNLSAHSTENKAEICAIEGALGFLVDLLSYKTPSKTLSIVENSGGILRNISSQIAVRDDYREILRNHNCLQVLLNQLKSPSLTIVSNACGTLWNLSAKCALDQDALWQMGAPAMLRSLNHSKHKMIAMGSSAALKNLLSARPGHGLVSQLDATAKAMDLPALPTLGARKQKALMKDLGVNLAETFDDTEMPVKNDRCVSPPPVKKESAFVVKPKSSSSRFSRSESQERVTRSEYSYENRSTRGETDQLCNTFTSLNISETSSKYRNDGDPPKKSRLPQYYGSASLPYATPRSPNAFVPVRNNYSDCDYEDEVDAIEHPIDYSRRYAEPKMPKSSAKEYRSSTSKSDGVAAKNSIAQLQNETYSIYAETDLDQPTDYSLRYAEDDSDSDICANVTKTGGSEFVQDTVKTYCTEGTPYETPFNFSTATSMSDLRLAVDSESEKGIIDNDKCADVAVKKEAKIPPLSHLDEKDHCSVEDISDPDSQQKNLVVKVKSEFSSGLMSPEKPVNYCEEGTPGYFSRVSSFGSLNSIPANDTVKLEEEKLDKTASEDEKKAKTLPKCDTSPAEAKAVKFEQVVNYAEETPLMFSRSSSLASLDSIEQHSIHDDRSSVVSDFSRLTSGIVSPSELPDSPTQTVPPSPKPRKSSMEFPARSGTGAFSKNSRPQAAPRAILKASVFEDNVTKFKEESTPVQFSTATSLSSLTIDDEPTGESQSISRSGEVQASVSKEREDGVEKQDAEKEKRSNDVAGNDDDMPTLSGDDDEDEDILTACINIGMQNKRSQPKQQNSPPRQLPSTAYRYEEKRQIPSINMPIPKTGIPKRAPANLTVGDGSTQIYSDSVRTYCTENTPAHLSRVGSNSDLSVLSVASNEKGKRDYLSDDSSNLSGDNDNILAECIKSGMPTARKSQSYDGARSSSALGNFANPSNQPKTSRSDGKSKREQLSGGYLHVKDETENYAVENTPLHYSLRSSLSDLTVDGSVVALTRTVPGRSSSDLDQKSSPPPLNKAVETNTGLQKKPKSPENASRHDSLSSLSAESLGSLEAEQALLEQCISSGMPSKNKPRENSTADEVGTVPQTTAKPKLPGENSSEPAEGRKKRVSSKNGNVASAAGNTTTQSSVCPATVTTTVAGVERDGKSGPNRSCARAATEADTSRGRCSPSGGTCSTGPKRSGCSLDGESSGDEDDLGKGVANNRMLDPDAMIESLDRFTAELVSQASLMLNNKDDMYVTSVTEASTWNEDTSSPNDVTFPSISGSAPVVITFKSEENEAPPLDDAVDGQTNDFSSINTSTMTESTLIAMEATKVATAFRAEADMSHSLASAASLELDCVQPPSHLNSLTNSAVGLDLREVKSPRLLSRKKSLPAGLMIRKLLSNSLNHTSSSLESLENHSLSNLDRMNPPSAMGELLDAVDFDGSMTSVASLSTSEVADNKRTFSVNNPIFNVKHSTNVLHMMNHSSVSSLTDLENVNPPSLFNEITDMCNSLADVPTEAICSEVYEDCYTHVNDLTTDVTEYSDAVSVTPIHSESSSSESSPKKGTGVNKNLTAKQKRNLARERYKTYTIAAEMVMKEEIDKMKESQIEDEEDVTDGICNGKTSPKERRRMEKSRFDTQVVDVASLSSDPDSKSEERSSDNQGRTKASIRRNFLQKRIENKERFRTRTINDTELVSNSTDVHQLVEAEANLVLKTLSETKTHAEEFLDCETLSLVSNEDDSENNSGSSINYRTYHKSWGLKRNRIPVVQSSSVSEKFKPDPINCCTSNLTDDQLEKYAAMNTTRNISDTEEPEQEKAISKPKIVKPSSSNDQSDEETQEPEIKAIRGRRKPLYSKAATNNRVIPKTTKPVKTMTSNLVKNVTSSIKSGSSSSLKCIVRKTAPKPTVQEQKPLKPPTGQKITQPRLQNASKPNSPQPRSPLRTNNSKPAPTSKPKPSTDVKLERQGTFTKTEPSVPQNKSKIPTPSTSIQKVLPSRIAKAVSQVNTKPVNGDRTRCSPRMYQRSPSVDSKDRVVSRVVQSSASSQSLRGEAGGVQRGLVKRSSIPSVGPRSSSNSSISLSSSVTKKQVTSKIASLWKKIEQNRSQPPKSDSRVWIQPDSTTDGAPKLIRSNTFDNKESVIFRNKGENVGSTANRLSRLGSFIVMDEENEQGRRCPVSVIEPSDVFV